MTFAERNYNHKDYGIFVSIKADNGKYVNLSAHLSGLASGIRKGVRVTDATIIGYGGDSGGPNILTGQPHLHQAYYRYPATTLTGHRTVAWGCAGPTRRPGRRETCSATKEPRLRARSDWPAYSALFLTTPSSRERLGTR